MSTNEHVQETIGLRCINVTLQIFQTPQEDLATYVNLPYDVLHLTQVPSLKFPLLISCSDLQIAICHYDSSFPYGQTTCRGQELLRCE
jgi:hypothetical protein